jgi:hypothetical protein
LKITKLSVRRYLASVQQQQTHARQTTNYN